eukprot:361915_1
MKECKYKLSIHESWITKLIKKYNTNLSLLNEIKTLFIDNNNNKNLISKTLLIDSYSKCGAIEYALKIFNSINDCEKDSQSICTMMKAYITNYYNDEAIQLYEKYNDLNDHISHLYAIKACINSRNIQKGRKIHWKLNLTDNNKDIKIKCALIDFYGICGDINNALQIYKSTQNKNKNIVMFSSMMNAYIYNNLSKDALILYNNINSEVTKDNISHILVLRACIDINDFKTG